MEKVLSNFALNYSHTHEEDYEPLLKVLLDAYNQAAKGKGHDRHANSKNFMDQPTMKHLLEHGPEGAHFQVAKKVREAINCSDDERAIRDLLGAIVYTAMIVLERENRNV